MAAFRRIVFAALLCWCIVSVHGQTGSFSRNYKPVKSASVVQDKNFYLLTLMQQLPEVKKVLQQNEVLNKIAGLKKAAVLNALAHCSDTISCYFKSLPYTTTEVDAVSEQLKLLYNRSAALQQMVAKQMRPSGYYALYENLSNEQLLLKAWSDAAKGINYIIQAYTTNTGLRYRNIDSVTYAINSGYYAIVINEMMLQVREQMQNAQLFFQPALTVALELLFVNDRDEAARFEPLNIANRAAYERIKTIDWAKYPYSVILSPGEGPENNMPISPNGKYRCRLAAERFKQKLAPFIVVSGGFVHPFQTPFNEAVEMKKYLMHNLQVPENAIIIEPHARHTTTNFRNANRIVYRNGIPVDKKILCSTTRYQADYIAADRFVQANLSTLGYLPFNNLKRLNDFDIEYLPTLNSLQLDNADPLDP